MVAWSFDDYPKTKTLFGGDGSFRWSLRLIYCWQLGKQWTGWWWECVNNFRGEKKKLPAEKDKQSTTLCVQDWVCVRNTKEKWALLTWNCPKKTSSKCDLSLHCRLKPVQIYTGATPTWELILHGITFDHHF